MASDDTFYKSRWHLSSRLRGEKRLIRQAGGQLADVEGSVEASAELLGVDEVAVSRSIWRSWQCTP